MSKKKRRQQAAVAAAKKQEKRTLPAAGWRSLTNWTILLLIVLPLLFSRQEIDPVLTVRYIFFAGFIVLFLVAFYVFRKKAMEINSPKLVKLIFGSGIAFTAWSCICSFSATNSAATYYEVSRYALNIVFLFLMMVMVSREEANVVKCCKALLIVSLIQSIVGILQFYEIAFTDLPGNYPPYGLMANRNLFGSAQVLLLPFAVFVLYKESRKWKYIAAIAIAGIITSVIISQTRSAWVATVAILVLSLAGIVIMSPVNRKKWSIATGIGIIGIAAIASLLVITDTEGTFSQSIKERSALISQNAPANSATVVDVKDRIAVWKKTIALIRDHPVLGVGPGNWKVIIASYGTKGLAWAGGYYVPDRPHNVYLLVAAETGIPGLIFYVALWVLIAWAAIRVIRNAANEDQRVLNILMLSGLAAFASDAMFSFPNERIEHSLYLLMMGGIILGSYCNLSGAAGKKIILKKNLWFFFLFIAIFNLFLGIKKNNFEVHLNKATAYDKLGEYRSVLNEVEAGKSTWVTIDPVGKSLQLYSCIAWKELKDYNKALQEAETARKYNPNSALVYNNTGTIYTVMGDFDKAIESYKKALQFAPDFETTYKNLAVNYFQVGKYDACIDALSHINVAGDKYLSGLLEEAKKRIASQKQPPVK
ncbi:MAG TPA: O-antigen ligase family protein [Chitinophagaceae bacterium]|nr:O-antigen ligase family protein [Chitinophagaceae bacterium]